MTDEDLMKELGKRMRERARADTSAGNSPEGQEALAPLSAQRREQIVQAALRKTRARRSPVPLHRSRRARLGAITLVVGGLAAGLVLAVLPSAPLPAYEHEVLGGERMLRSGEASTTGAKVLTRDGFFEWRLRPATSVSGKVAVRFFVLQDGRVIPWNVSVVGSTEGAWRIAGRVGDLGLPAAGSMRLIAVVSRPSDAPAELSPETLEAPPEGWRVFTTDVELRP